MGGGASKPAAMKKIQELQSMDEDTAVAVLEAAEIAAPDAKAVVRRLRRLDGAALDATTTKLLVKGLAPGTQEALIALIMPSDKRPKEGPCRSRRYFDREDDATSHDARRSYGQVFQGLDLETGALIAVKTLLLPVRHDGDDEPSDSLKKHLEETHREIAILSTLKHDNIVKYLGSEIDEPEAKIHIFQDAVHRDIKGENVLISDTGVAKLADFGASKRLGEEGTLMQTGSLRARPSSWRRNR
ncbi:MAP kinase kinase kinase [Aureococcus anophagefferens]|nr:MAP kinase kinase kinase [Aureococcus anophagefferens]